MKPTATVRIYLDIDNRQAAAHRTRYQYGDKLELVATVQVPTLQQQPDKLDLLLKGEKRQ